ncbi:protein of unknown function [Streptomyces sp. KY75]|nr:protein of unknown function [Streptomyces sp. KY70]CAD5980654.1 protein of unknown function [Streptomyces sp. KY75]
MVLLNGPAQWSCGWLTLSQVTELTARQEWSCRQRLRAAPGRRLAAGHGGARSGVGLGSPTRGGAAR